MDVRRYFTGPRKVDICHGAICHGDTSWCHMSWCVICHGDMSLAYVISICHYHMSLTCTDMSLMYVMRVCHGELTQGS